MSNKNSIKILSISDFDLIKDIFFTIFTNDPWNDDLSNEDQLNKYILDIIDNKNSLSIGLVTNHEIIGIALGSIMHWYTGTEYYIKEFCIKKAYQNKGIGTIFIKKIEEYLIENKIAAIILSTDRNTPAYYFYEKNNSTELPKSCFFHKKLI